LLQLPYDPEAFFWEGSDKYMPAIEILKQLAEKIDFKHMLCIPFGWNLSFQQGNKSHKW
jgi:hypothetical protein